MPSREMTCRVALLAICIVLHLAAGSAELRAEEGRALWPDAAEIEDYLQQARVIERRKLGRGITNPERVTLEKNGTVTDAVFKDVDGEFDNWRFEVAAYEMDKLLGLGMVPPTVERRLGGRKGCLQLWVDGETMDGISATPRDLEGWRRQVSLMWLFDDLIANIDRHMNNAIVTPEFRLALIDNSKTFRSNRDLINGLNRAGASGTHARYWMVPFDKDRKEYPTRYRKALIQRLRSLTGKQVKAAVGRYIRPYDRNLILQRRQLILERLEELEAAAH